MTQFLVTEAVTGRIQKCQGKRDPDGFTGTPDLRPFPKDGHVYYPWQEKLVFTDEAWPTGVLHFIDGSVRRVETAPIADLRAGAINAIDAAGEALRHAVISMPTQAEEYRRVETQARAWKLAGYPEDEAPRGVRGWAMAKHREGWTNRQACDDILSTADAWLNVLDTIRDLRLMNKEDVRHATEPATIRTIENDMRADMRALAAQLQLTITPD